VSQFNYIQGVYSKLRNSQYLRLSEDAVPERSIFVYRYFADYLLSFAQKELPISLTKRILKDTLRGLAALQDQNIVHTGKSCKHLSLREPPLRQLMGRRRQGKQHSSRLGEWQSRNSYQAGTTR
jgi:hypothetical protein